MNVFRWNKDHLISLAVQLTEQRPFNRGEWQSLDVSSSRVHDTHELTDVTVVVDHIPTNVQVLMGLIQPDLPWAEDHFGERVGRVPLNPPPSSVYWPYAVRDNGDHTDEGGRFDHTYPERFWPRHAGTEHTYFMPDGEHATANWGIRFRFGDLDDVVDLLVRNPFTRQAYLPVWFPEDTGAASGQRVPCTLGYHFMAQPGNALGAYLSCRYYIRSCDALRHFHNDVYLACRLMQWVCDEVNRKKSDDDSPLFPGRMTMHIGSLHGFTVDNRKIMQRFGAQT